MDSKEIIMIALSTLASDRGIKEEELAEVPWMPDEPARWLKKIAEGYRLSFHLEDGLYWPCLR